ncbi:hypothetical protein ABPG72_019801 [Tetrahymena utriculariae]
MEEESLFEEFNVSPQMSEEEEIPQRRGRKKGLFKNVEAFDGKQFLTKSTPVVFYDDEKYGEYDLEEYFDSDLKDCLQLCQKSVRKVNEIISQKTYFSNFIPHLEIKKVYMSMLEPLPKENNVYEMFMLDQSNRNFIEQRMIFFENSFKTHFSLLDFEKFMKKKIEKSRKIQHFFNEVRQPKLPQTHKKKIKKDRLYNHYTFAQIQTVQGLLQANHFQNFEKISLKSGVKISTIKKISSKMQKGEPVRNPKQPIDCPQSFTTEEKSTMLREAVSKNFSNLNLREKCQRYNQLFQKNIRYKTYRNFFVYEGFSYRSLTYKPLATEQNRNKWQVFQSSFHLIENFENCSDIIAIDESGLNEKCFSKFVWAPRGIEKKLARDVRLQNHSLVMAISMRYGVIAYQIKYQSLNSGYFFNFIKKALNYYEANLQSNQPVCVVMDNSRIHKMEAITQFMVDSPFKFVFTAPYSSPMNPIEEVFGTIKSMQL